MQRLSQSALILGVFLLVFVGYRFYQKQHTSNSRPQVSLQTPEEPLQTQSLSSKISPNPSAENSSFSQAPRPAPKQAGSALCDWKALGEEFFQKTQISIAHVQAQYGLDSVNKRADLNRVFYRLQGPCPLSDSELERVRLLTPQGMIPVTRPIGFETSPGQWQNEDYLKPDPSVHYRSYPGEIAYLVDPPQDRRFSLEITAAQIENAKPKMCANLKWPQPPFDIQVQRVPGMKNAYFQAQFQVKGKGCFSVMGRVSVEGRCEQMGVLDQDCRGNSGRLEGFVAGALKGVLKISVESDQFFYLIFDSSRGPNEGEVLVPLDPKGKPLFNASFKWSRLKDIGFYMGSD